MIFFNNEEMVSPIGEILNIHIYSMHKFILKQRCKIIVEYESCYEKVVLIVPENI
jgi:hypothetical protein